MASKVLIGILGSFGLLFGMADTSLAQSCQNGGYVVSVPNSIEASCNYSTPHSSQVIFSGNQWSAVGTTQSTGCGYSTSYYTSAGVQGNYYPSYIPSNIVSNHYYSSGASAIAPEMSVSPVPRTSFASPSNFGSCPNGQCNLR